MPSPNELVYFIEVAETLNISRAAERLGISQPTLSLSLQKLESTLGRQLFIRTKAGVQLTRAGTKLVSQARNLIWEWDKIQSDALKDESEIRGRYVLGCHPSVALYSLPRLFPKLLEAHPLLEIKLHHDLSRRITEDVISFKIDFGIVVNPWQHPDLIIKPLWKDEVSLWVSPRPSPLQDPKSGKAVLVCDPDLLQTQSILKQLSKKGFTFQRTITSSSLEVIATIIESKGGVGVLPARVATRLKERPLRRLPGNDQPKFQDSIALVYRADAQKSKASRALAHFMERELRELT